MLELATVLALAAQCAPDASARTLAAVAWTESRFDPLAIGVNRGSPLARRPADRPAAVRMARARLAAGGDLDLGLGQINSANLGPLGLSLEDAFDPCRNLNASARVLGAGYDVGEDRQTALRRALSRYNTGHPTRGIANGYVARVQAAWRHLFGFTGSPPDLPAPPRPSISAQPAPASWDVFGRAAWRAGDALPAPEAAQ